MGKNQKRYLGLILTVMLIVVMVFSTSLISASNPKAYEVNDIHLKVMKIHPHKDIKMPKGLMKKGYSQNEEGPYLIVFNGPIKELMKNDVRNVGAKLVEYIPDFAYLSVMTPQVAEKVKNLTYVEDIIVYHPGFKLNTHLKDNNGNIKLNEEVTVRIATFNDDASILDNEIKNSNGKKLGHSKGNVIVKMNSNHLEKFAKLNSVKFIEPKVEHVLHNDVAKEYMDVDDLWNLGYEGTGQVVAVCDTGIDTGVNDSSMHLDFQGRIDSIYALGRRTADDPHGHGTHVAGSVLGDGASSGGQYKGTAPKARLVFQSVLDRRGGLGGLPRDLNDLFAEAWDAGARIHTNSWGAPVYGDYNTDSQQVDEYVWNNDMIILFSAGNEGDGASGTDYDSIGSPGTAKNCITVGASENYRPNMPMTGWGNIGDDVDEIAAFSSRGWTEDGRIKPDIVAPGTWILSTKSSIAPESNYWMGFNTDYAYMGGTSMSTPLVAGAVAVAREYMQTEWNHTPSPAMMKAAVINGGIDMGFGFPSADQGWGRISLTNSLSSKEYKYEDETYSLNTGQTQSFNYNIQSTNTPFKITLVWTDYPGSTVASKALVNDLDIKITSPTGKVYYGNDFTNPFDTGYDRTNNVENIFINSPEAGDYTVEVIGYNVPQGAQPFVLFSSADFGAGSSDTTPPTCSITSPNNNDTVSGTITVNAFADDNVGVDRVEFYVDGNMVGNDTTSPYSINWDTTSVNNGAYTLQAKAFDAAGNVGNSEIINVTVDNNGSVVYVTNTYNDNVTKGSDIEYFIDVTAQGNIDLSLSFDSKYNLGMKLLNPIGVEVASGTNSILYSATETGSYKIVVNNSTKGKPTTVPFTLEATYPIIQ